jgi:ubiquinone/menaquinone biosynthesis C-methylase UbiE
LTDPIGRRIYDPKYRTLKMLSDYVLLKQARPEGAKVLNIGCCEPGDEVFWAKIVSSWHAVDTNRDIVSRGRDYVRAVLSDELGKRIEFMVGDVRRLPLPDETYGIVTCFSTIDHIPSGRETAIEEMVRVLKTGGYLVVTVPNKLDPVYRRWSRRSQRLGETDYEHQFSPWEIRRMVQHAGCEVVACASNALNTTWWVDALLERAGLGRLKMLFGCRYGCLARKPDTAS